MEDLISPIVGIGIAQVDVAWFSPVTGEAGKARYVHMPPKRGVENWTLAYNMSIFLLEVGKVNC